MFLFPNDNRLNPSQFQDKYQKKKKNAYPVEKFIFEMSLWYKEALRVIKHFYKKFQPTRTPLTSPIK